MIHIATVHYQTDKWIDIQLSYLKKYIEQPYRVYAFLSGDAVRHKDKFYYASVEPIDDHATKLNILADIVYFAQEDENDILMFLDGDAFPISNLDQAIASSMAEYPLVAVQRVENLGDIQPHPLFCYTTPNFWRKIRGDWRKGYEWQTKLGLRTDVGGNLLKILTDHCIQWEKLHRTSGSPLHKIFYGVYGNLVYHHGSGFRIPTSRYDWVMPIKALYNNRKVGHIMNLLYKCMPIRIKRIASKQLGIRRKITAYHKLNSNRIYEQIREGDLTFLTS